MLSARDKLAAFEHDVIKATNGASRKHLNGNELKALLADAELSTSGKKDALVTRARQHSAALVARATSAAAGTGAGATAATATGAAAATGTAVSGTAARASGTAAPATGSAGTGTAAAGAAAERASVNDRNTPLGSLRTAVLPKGLTLTAAKAAKLAAVFPTCGALAESSDRALREALEDGRLPGITKVWLRRLQASLAHLVTDDSVDSATGGAAADSAAEAADMELEPSDLATGLAAAVDADGAGNDDAGTDEEDAISDSDSDSSLGSGADSDDDADSNSSEG